MELAVALLAAALSLTVPLAGAHRPLADEVGARAHLTEILTPDRPFQTFLRYLQQTNLVEVFEKQAYRTHHGITLFAPADRAFAAVHPSVLSGLKKHQLKNLMMYHALAKHYALKEFDGLSRVSQVTTFAGGMYTVNVTCDPGAIRVQSRWAAAKILGTVYGVAPMAVYEIDRVLLPEAIFRVQPPVEAALPDAEPAASAPGAKGGNATTTPGDKAEGERSACRAAGRLDSYVAAMALCAASLVAAL
ncbi:fasciclin-like arabinogalactan protein 7 [Hordeum vulgare subsp. vulgare]|uniref:FAS1 domain-containing protein n=1 Tax=Hordeum vulgare subsp. vulgare TaxID=112509 RepID=A0A8I6X912_HORVV|nr:fasciclin-like arabinogalactan protein 7 [Hordeum vulgare subsp. vulgare]